MAVLYEFCFYLQGYPREPDSVPWEGLHYVEEERLSASRCCSCLACQSCATSSKTPNRQECAIASHPRNLACR
eukprot:1083859-Amphidinium_carterae.1